MPEKSNQIQNSYIPLTNQKAASETSFGVNLLAFCFATIFLLMAYYAGLENMPILFLLYGSMLAVFQTCFEGVFFDMSQRFKIYRKISWKRVLYKEVALIVTMAVIAFIYWLFPMYRFKNFDGEYFEFLRYLVPCMLFLSVPYFALMDKVDANPDDIYWQLGYGILHFKKTVTRFELANYVRSWLVKVFWLALMQPSMVKKIFWFVNLNVNMLTVDMSFWFFTASSFCFFIDLAYASTGYLMNLKILNAQTRTAEPTLLGWMVAIVCYWPFWDILFYPYFFAYNEVGWQRVFAAQSPMWWIWFGAIILLELLYAFATVAGGIRFSNLTYRGLWNTGPYKYTKHPAYVCKNISWWLIAVPFMAASPAKGIRLSVLLLLNNLIYYMRAKTEERHLSHYPEYVEYALMMNEKSIFRWFAKIFPFLKYKPLLKKERLFDVKE